MRSSVRVCVSSVFVYSVCDLFVMYMSLRCVCDVGVYWSVWMCVMVSIAVCVHSDNMKMTHAA